MHGHSFTAPTHPHLERESTYARQRPRTRPVITPEGVHLRVFTFCIVHRLASHKDARCASPLVRPTHSIPPTRGLSDHRFPWMTSISGLRDLDPIRIGRGIGASPRGEQVSPPLPHAATPSRYSPEERVTVTPPRVARASQVRQATSILSASAEVSAQDHAGSR